MTPPDPTHPTTASIPRSVDVAAAWAWRLLLLGGAAVALVLLVGRFSAVAVPIGVALLLAALLWPLRRLLVARKVPRALAAALSMLAMVAVVVSVIGLIGTQVAGESGELVNKTLEGVARLNNWLATGPLHVSTGQMDAWLGQFKDWIGTQKAALAKSGIGFGTSIADLLAGLGLAMFTTFYLLFDGAGIWRFVLGFLPRGARVPTSRAALHGWAALVAYVRATVLVAAIDAVVIMIAALALRVPMAFALGALIFICAFIPLMGALISGLVAVLVALVTLGGVQALVLLAVIVLVMQLEGHVLQPFLLGKAVDIHPLGVLFGLAVGIVLGGIVGALIAVPLLAFGNAFVRALGAAEADEPIPSAEPGRTDAEVVEAIPGSAPVLP